jgi:D-alanine--poly(phosphoribitol) ligase subunit 1
MKILNLLKISCKKYSNKVAIKFSEKKINYRIFWKKINIYLKFIKLNKINKILIIENNKEDEFCYVMFFASLLGRATYIPISLDTPKKRVQKIIDITKPCCVLSLDKESYRNTKNIVPKDINNCRLIIKRERKINSNIAYIIFTSGSTGEPKGVCITRNALDHYVQWLTKFVFNNSNIKCPHFSRIGFDLSIVDIYGTLCTGNTLFPMNNSYDRTFVNKFIKKNKINFWVSVPTAVDLFDLVKKNELKAIEKYFFCGEPLKKRHLERIFKINKNSVVYNTYGPTEATVSCSFLKLTNKNYKKYNSLNISFGKPIKNISFYLDGHNKNEGELLISGVQLARGYLNNKKLTKKNFITQNQKEVYKTGDICKKINGNYYFLNRRDNQVKIKGYRIELGEIDSVLDKIFKINSNTIIVSDKIITFIEQKISKKKIIFQLKKNLPSYMMPSKIIFIKKWPRNKNFKIDTGKLKLMI